MSRRARSIGIAISALALLSLTLAACGGSDSDGSASASGAPDGETVLRIGVPSTWGYTSSLMARDFQPGHGVRFAYSLFPASIDARAALTAGKIDLLETGDVGASQAFLAAKGDVKVIAVTAPNPEQSAWVVRKDSDLKKPADLRGHTIAVSFTTNNYPAAKNLIEAGGLTTKDVKLVNLGASDAVSALTSGQVDLISGIEPTLSYQIASNPSLRVFSSLKGYGDNIYPYLVSGDAFRTKKKAVEQFVTSLNAQFDYIAKNRDKHAETLAKFLKISPEAVREGFEKGSNRLQPIDDTFLAQEQKTVDEYLKLGIIDQAVDVHQLYVGQFNRLIK